MSAASNDALLAVSFFDSLSRRWIVFRRIRSRVRSSAYIITTNSVCNYLHLIMVFVVVTRSGSQDKIATPPRVTKGVDGSCHSYLYVVLVQVRFSKRYIIHEQASTYSFAVVTSSKTKKIVTQTKYL